jgi:hypothetical protein
MAHKLRAQALTIVEAKLGPRVRELPEVQGSLVEMQIQVREIELLDGSDASPSDWGPMLAEFLFRASTAAEAVLQNLLSASPRDHGETPLGRDRASNVGRFTAIAKELGFRLQADETLPEHLVMIAPHKIASTIRQSRGTLNPLALALLLLASAQEDHPLRALPSRLPDFLSIVADLSGRRGHGNLPGIAVEEVERVAGEVFELTSAILEIIP